MGQVNFIHFAVVWRLRTVSILPGGGEMLIARSDIFLSVQKQYSTTLIIRFDHYFAFFLKLDQLFKGFGFIWW